MSGLNIDSMVDAVAAGFWIAGTQQVLFHKGSIRSIFSRDTLMRGGQIAVATGVYNQFGRPLVAGSVGKLSAPFVKG